MPIPIVVPIPDNFLNEKINGKTDTPIGNFKVVRCVCF